MAEHDLVYARGLPDAFHRDWEPGIRPAVLVERYVGDGWPHGRAIDRRQLVDILVVFFNPLMFANSRVSDDMRERCETLVAAWVRRCHGGCGRSEPAVLPR